MAMDDVTNPRPKPKYTVEFPVPGEFASCLGVEWGEHARCGSTERFIQFVPTNHGRRLICPNEHTQQIDGREWIPHEEFGPLGLFPNVLPRELRPTDSQILQSRWNPPKEAKRRHENAAECAKCDAPPFPPFSDESAELWEWLTERDPEMLILVHAELGKKPGAEIADWLQTIPAALKMKITHRTNMSMLAIDHGVPRKLANSIWHLLSRPQRRFLQRNFLFSLCKKCNGKKGSRLFERAELEHMYIKTYYDGSRAAAMIDAKRWELLQTTLDLVYEQRSLA